MSRRRDARQVIEAYKAAWGVRRANGDAADEVLARALIGHGADRRWIDQGSVPHDALFRMWARGVRPNRVVWYLFTEFLRSSVAIYATIRSSDNTEPDWATLPASKKWVSDRWPDATFPPKLLKFTPDAEAGDLLLDCVRTIGPDEDGEREVEVWLEMDANKVGRAAVLIGEQRAGWTLLEEADWRVMRSAERGEEIYADGILRFSVDDQGGFAADQLSVQFAAPPTEP